MIIFRFYLLKYLIPFDRQLKAAKERLRRLQELVNQVQAIPGLAAALPDDVTAELNRQATGFTETSSGVSAAAISRPNPCRDVRYFYQSFCSDDTKASFMTRVL